jgi:glycosyltransferase involved in cell wall biosynthesis
MRENSMANVAVSVLIPTLNVGEKLVATLESVKWAKEIVIVDSFSDDQTLEIAGRYGARILARKYVNSAMQKNWALAECTSPWILQVDSDEIISPELRDEIALTLKAVPEDVHAFRMPRMNFFLGEWLRYGGNYPDYQTRLFRRGLGRWQEREVHAHVEVPGRVGTLVSAIAHDDWPTLSKMLARLDRYTRYEADELRKQGEVFRGIDLVLRPASAFLSRYIGQGGFLDGWRGFIFCVYTACYVFMTRAKLWEMKTLMLFRSPEK